MLFSTFSSLLLKCACVHFYPVIDRSKVMFTLHYPTYNQCQHEQEEVIAEVFLINTVLNSSCARYFVQKAISSSSHFVLEIVKTSVN